MEQPINNAAHLVNNVKDVALIFEGGGMRNSYSSGVVNVLLEQGIYFENVYGLSAGANNAIDYLARDRWRSRVTFTEYTDDLKFRKLVSLYLQRGTTKEGGHQHYAKPDSSIPYDFEAFHKNPACLTLQSLERDTGKTIYWTQKDFSTQEELMLRVRASLSYPVIMSPCLVDGRVCYDGGLGIGGGFMVPRAKEDGFQRYFVVSTRPRDFRRKDQRNRFYDIYFWRRPHVKEAFDTWAARYNAELDRLEHLEKEGRAYMFYAQDQSVENIERSVDKLKRNYEKGYAQAQRELDTWTSFLGL